MPESCAMQLGAATSAELPAGFQQPAPLRESGKPPAEGELGTLPSRTASLSLLRLVAWGGGLPWLAYLLLGIGRYLDEGGSFALSPDILIPGLWLLLLVLSLLVISAGFIHRERYYFWSLLIAGGIFVLILLPHIALVLLTGSSPVREMHLGDFAGLPVALLLAVLPTRWVLLAAGSVVAAAAAVNLGSPPGFNMLLEVAHSVLVMLPFLLLLRAGRGMARLLDEVAARAHLTAGQLAQAKALRELETRFLAYLHDKVMNTLDAIRRGIGEPTINVLGDHAFAADTLGRSAQIGVREVVAELAGQLRALAPHLQVRAPRDLPEGATIPADTAAVLGDAALEATHNTLRHAAGAPVRADLVVNLAAEECTGFSVSIRDEGPGFDPAEIPASRAGVRVAIAGRMQAMDGCDLELNTAPGEGTEVILSWHRNGPVSGTSTVEVPSAYQLIGMDRVFRLRNALIAAAVFWAMSLNNHHQSLWLWLSALGCILVALLMVIRGTQLRLSHGPTVVAVAATLMFLVLARLDFLTSALLWPHTWYPWVFILLCSYLALRDRAWVAWGTWGTGLVISEVLSARNLGEPAELPVAIVSSSALLLPATLIPKIIKRSTRALPGAFAARQGEIADIEVMVGQRRFLSDTSAWVADQVAAILDPGFPADTRRANAHLLELKLRDSIRSPALASVELNRAIWDARARGCWVQILDSRSEPEGLSGPQDQVLLAGLQEQLIEILADKEVREITVRLFPRGRARFATILVTPREGGPVRRVDVTETAPTPLDTAG